MTAIDEMFEHFPHLETPHLILRQIEPRDAEALFATFSDAETMQFYDQLPHRTIEESRELIRKQQEWYARHQAIRWGITRKGDATNEVIGSCGLFKFDEGGHYAETGYELRRAYWRQGIMTEALTSMLTFAFGTLGLHRVEAVIDDANGRSKGLLLKLGFTHEGTLRQRFFFRERFWDEEYFGLLSDEWQPASSRQ
jgi:ribosomal-protein-alanine N-acetyltransferase